MVRGAVDCGRSRGGVANMVVTWMVWRSRRTSDFVCDVSVCLSGVSRRRWFDQLRV